MTTQKSKAAHGVSIELHRKYIAYKQLLEKLPASRGTSPDEYEYRIKRWCAKQNY
ncbi:hypothetical protein FACS1894219_10670 [Clostridia bacterium]|nr:hypothetical protein FACS1894219_10670 [Clostridia bacterium]